MELLRVDVRASVDSARRVSRVSFPFSYARTTLAKPRFDPLEIQGINTWITPLSYPRGGRLT